MELRTLRYFVAIADTGSVTAAARLLHVAQPSLSRQLRQLETELGVDLFHRRDGRLQLSAGGRQFLPFAQDVLRSARTAGEVATTLATGRLDRVRIAAPGTTLTDVIAPFLATLEPDDPLPEVRAEVPRDVYRQLRRGADSVDLVIGTEPPPAGLSSLRVADLPVWAYVRPDHEWSGNDAVEVTDLVSRTLLVLTEDFHPRRALDRATSEARAGYTDLLEFGVPDVVQALAAANRGIAIVSDDPRFGLHPLRINAPSGQVTITLYAAWEPSHHARKTLAALAQRLRTFCITRYGTDTNKHHGSQTSYYKTY
jgi:DNA-binding transcriptional LysR family regulator